MNRKILVPILALVICVVLIIAGISFIFGQVGPIQEQTAKLQADTKLLSEKRATLETVKEFITGQADITRLALPSGNSTAAVLAQIKKIAQEEGVVITSTNATSFPTPDGPQSTRYEIKTTSDYAQMQAFLLRLKNILPLVNITDFKIEDNGSGGLTSTLALSSFWAALPQTLPEITGTLENLTEDEINVLSRIAGFELPVFEELAPEFATGSGRLDPFISQ